MTIGSRTAGVATLLAVALAMCASPCLGVIADNFDDDARDLTIWGLDSLGEAEVTEINQQVEYTSLGLTGQHDDGENEAYYTLNSPVPYASPWTATLEVDVLDYQGQGDHEYGIEMSLANANDFSDQLWFGLYRGIWDGEPFFDWSLNKETDGVGPDFWLGATSDDGTLKLVWDGTLLSASYDEGGGFQPLTTVGLADWGMNASSTFRIAIGGWDGECDFALNDGSKLNLDNFVLEIRDTVIIPEPGTVALLGAGLLALIRRRKL